MNISIVQEEDTNEIVNTPWTTVVCDATGRIVQITNYDKQLLWQLPSELIIGEQLKELELFVGESNRKYVRAFANYFQEIISKKKNKLFRYKSLTEDGVIFYASCYAVYESLQRASFCIMPIDEEDYIGSYSETNSKTQFALKTANIKLWSFNTQTQYVTVTDNPFSGHGMTLNLTIKECLDFIHPNDQKRVEELIDSMTRGEIVDINIEIKTRSYSDGKWKNFVYIGSLYEKDNSEKNFKYTGVYKDHTALYEKWGLPRIVLDYVPIPIDIKDVENNNQYIFRNKESDRLFGDGILKVISDNAVGGLINGFNKTDQYVFETGEPYCGQEKIITSDGRIYETIVRKSIIYEDEKRYLLIVRWDISDQEELQRKSKALSVSMDALNAFTWYYDSRDEKLIFGDGFEKTGGDRNALGSMIDYACRIHPEDREGYLNFITRFMEQDKGEFAIEYRIDFANVGNYEWWECRGVMETISKNNSQFKYIYGMDINIDSHKHAELALMQHKSELDRLNKQNELVLNNINSGLAYISSGYLVQWENVSISNVQSPCGNYEQGRLCYEGVNGRSTPCEKCIVQDVFRSKQMKQIELDSFGNKTMHVLVTPVLNENGDVEGVVLRIDDISERKQMIFDLQKAKAQAEQSDKLKSAFLANMSHEIRTPLNSIVGFSELLLSVTSQEEKEEYKNIIYANNELLLKLINDILDLSKIEAGFVELKPQSFDFAPYFDEITMSCQHRITKPNIDFIINNPYENCFVELDKNRLAQILTNYLTNAIKYTAAGRIEVGYNYVDSCIMLYVKDSGIGISEQKKHKVFQRFEKLDEFAQGTGLGLSICKAIAEAFGGTVGFESEENKGSTFWASIPCVAEVR